MHAFEYKKRPEGAERNIRDFEKRNLPRRFPGRLVEPSRCARVLVAALLPTCCANVRACTIKNAGLRRICSRRTAECPCVLSAVQGRLQWLGHCGEGGTTIGARLGTPAPTAREASSIAEVDNHDVPVRCMRKNRWGSARGGLCGDVRRKGPGIFTSTF